MNQVSIKTKNENLLRTKTKGFKEYISIYLVISNNHSLELSLNPLFIILLAMYPYILPSNTQIVKIKIFHPKKKQMDFKLKEMHQLVD